MPPSPPWAMTWPRACTEEEAHRRPLAQTMVCVSAHPPRGSPRAIPLRPVARARGRPSASVPATRAGAPTAICTVSGASTMNSRTWRWGIDVRAWREDVLTCAPPGIPGAARRPGARQHAMCYTDLSVVYAGLMPAVQHQAISRFAQKTTHTERCSNTCRQRVARLRREALSFSKDLAHQFGVMKRFMCHDTLTKAPA
jgi:hypothetical protein